MVAQSSSMQHVLTIKCRQYTYDQKQNSRHYYTKEFAFLRPTRISQPQLEARVRLMARDGSACSCYNTIRICVVPDRIRRSCRGYASVFSVFSATKLALSLPY